MIERTKHLSSLIRLSECKSDGVLLVGQVPHRLYIPEQAVQSIYDCQCRLQGPTWQQAVQYIQEVPMRDGERYTVTVKHDTYGLSFSLCSDTASTSLVPVAPSLCNPSPLVPLYVRPYLPQIKVSGIMAEVLWGQHLALHCEGLAQPDFKFLTDAA